MTSSLGEFPMSALQLDDALKEICERTFAEATDYDRGQVDEWSGNIINQTLSLLLNTLGSDTHKYSVQALLIQHDSLATYQAQNANGSADPAAATNGHHPDSDSDSGATPVKEAAAAVSGKAPKHAQNAGRGMHAATGSFWDAATDGQHSFKFEGEGRRGFDVVVSVIWLRYN